MKPAWDPGDWEINRGHPFLLDISESQRQAEKKKNVDTHQRRKRQWVSTFSLVEKLISRPFESFPRTSGSLFVSAERYPGFPVGIKAATAD